jgi:hypothetical protein
MRLKKNDRQREREVKKKEQRGFWLLLGDGLFVDLEDVNGHATSGR